MDASTETLTPMRRMRGIELVTRNSIHSLRASSVTSTSISFGNDDNIWKLTDLRTRFRNRDLETLYDRYQQRLMHVDLKGFLLLQIFLSTLFIVLLCVLGRGAFLVVLPDIIGQAVLLVTACVFYSLAYREELFKKHKYLHCLMAVLLTLFLVTVDLALDLWFAFNNEGTVFHVPAALYTILAVYNLLPIASIRFSVVTGVFVAFVHLLASVFLLQRRFFDRVDVWTIVADVAFYVAANAVGIFTKCLNETTLRRAFLDRRRCIESTIKLEYEKRQEEQLMLSILPQHIADVVGTDIREEVQLMRIEKTSPSTRKPFDKLHVETHQDVTVLYADIVNFTPLTATLSSGDLVSMLNELFGKFDEAASENNCLRIKILGDCYYCVSGLPDSSDDHAKNCVKMGFKMIEIIQQVREDHQVEVDMRIGVHSGSVISGLIGLRKWQFDIWGQDVTIANHMEQSGKPGRVHISMATKALLGDAYRYEKASANRDSYLTKLGIQTYLVVEDAANKKPKDGDTKKIKFKTDPFATLPRAVLPINNAEGSPSFRRLNSETPKDSNNTSLDSLYEKLPSSLPVMTNHYRNTAASLPHIFTKMRRYSNANGDENTEEIYNRVLRNARKSSATAGTGRRIIARRRSTTGENVNRRGAVLMDNTLVSFRKMMDQADSKMANAIESMRLSKFKSRSVPDQEQPVNVCLLFSNRNWELPFLRRPDPLFNLYILGAIPVLAGILIIQFCLFPPNHYSNPRSFWLVFGVALIVVVLVGICLWLPQLWRRSQNSVANESEDILGNLSVSAEPNSNRSSTSTISAAFFKLDALCESLTARVFIFLAITIAVEACGLVDLGIIVSYKPEQNATMAGQCEYKDPRIYLWYFTHICALTMTVAFGFYQIHFALKFTFYVAALITYTILASNIYPNICSMYPTEGECLLCEASPAVTPVLSHTMYLFAIVLVLHVADRQIEFIYRLDYVWQRQLVNEKDEANTTRIVNKMLLQNILPLHVAEVYLDTSRCSEQLYHEEHNNVAVMFASIPNFMDFYADNETGDGDLHCIEVLNSIISAFDALSFEGPFIRIEKIKIVGSTYMAASGLTSARKGSTETVTESESCVSSLLTMLNFASSMNTALDRLNRNYSLNFRLRTGIDYGPVIAGVVGAQKPLYDIWGDTVNMASRLESTGQLGEIQITEKTAQLLDVVGFHCEKKGETFLKGKGYVVTYFARPEPTDLYGTVGSASVNQSFLGLSNIELLPASARSSVSRQKNRPSILFEEDDEYCITPQGKSLTPPRFSFELIEEVETASQSSENIYSDITEVSDEEVEMAYF